MKPQFTPPLVCHPQRTRKSQKKNGCHSERSEESAFALHLKSKKADSSLRSE
jgi:hypothetical protein